jgi:hypothetical protein
VVDQQGDYSVVLEPKKNATYEAKWIGDGTYAPARSARVTVKVQVVIRTKMSAFYSKIGAYHLFHRTVDPRYFVEVVPNHRDESVLLQLQRYRSGSWRSLASRSFGLNRYSRLGVFIDHRALDVGTRYRIRAVFKSDTDHLGATARWSYFRMTL